MQRGSDPRLEQRLDVHLRPHERVRSSFRLTALEQRLHAEQVGLDGEHELAFSFRHQLAFARAQTGQTSASAQPCGHPGTYGATLLQCSQ